MDKPPRPRLEPRLVFVGALLAFLGLYLAAQVVLVRSGDACEDSAVGGLAQLFLPGQGCEREVPRRGPGEPTPR